MSASHDRADRAGSTDSRDRGQRWSSLLGLLAGHGRLSVSQVCAELGVSEATVRRDFRELAAQQPVTRTHGGVVATSVAYALPALYKSALADDDKERIARAAALLIAPGSVVGFNGGTTTSATARQLAARADLYSKLPVKTQIRLTFIALTGTYRRHRLRRYGDSAVSEPVSTATRGRPQPRGYHKARPIGSRTAHHDGGGRLNSRGHAPRGGPT